MKCEYCSKEHDGKYGSGRFCSLKCKCGFAGIENRLNVNKKQAITIAVQRSMKVGGREIITSNICQYGCGKAAYFVFNGRNRKEKFCCSQYIAQCPGMIEKNKLGLANRNRSGVVSKRKSWGYWDAISNEEIFCLNSPVQYMSTLVYLAKRRGLVDFSKCSRSLCGISEWYGEKLVCHLHHKNGNRKDNRIDNWEILCPNCHSLTKNYAGKGRKWIADQQKQTTNI